MEKFEKLETYSNFSYFIVGLLGLILYNSPMFLILMTVLSLGSFTFHKYLKGNIYLFDWIAMNVAILGLAAMKLDNELAWAAASILMIIYGYWLVGKFNVYKEVAVACVPLIAVLFTTMPFINVLIILGVFALAIFIRSIDAKKNKRYVFYDSIFHSIWHLLTAIGFYLIIVLAS